MKDPSTIKVTDASKCVELWFNSSLYTCEPFLDCTLQKPTISYKWRLDVETNTCRKVRPGMKFQVGLGVMMIFAILGAFLFLVLDDRFFCLKNPKVELQDAGFNDPAAPGDIAR